MSYQLLDCGDQKKVEIFGKYKLVRPCPQALWPIEDTSFWEKPDAEFIRIEKEKGIWKTFRPNLDLTRPWIIENNGMKWHVEANEFGNVGVFTEHWTYTQDLLDSIDKSQKVLNLFSYSGSSCLRLVKEGYKITVVDSSKSAMDTYNHNLELNKLSRDGQRLILEDVYKFISREHRRNSTYGAIMIDAPSYGRGTKGEVFQIEDDLVKLILQAKSLLSDSGVLFLTLHSPRFTPAILQTLISRLFRQKQVRATEIINPCQSGIGLPSGFLVKVR